MRHRFVLCVLVVFLEGCVSTPKLVRTMAKHGITDQNTEKIVATGSEGGWGASTQVVLDAHFLVQDVWDAIYQSRPNDVWYASGYRKLDFYRHGEGDAPCLTLLVNASDSCHIEGTTKRFRCPGINRGLDVLLKQEYESKQAQASENS